ncbi:hypothetical protein AAFF27_09700 [Xylophilus sp. GW821-FHT01B05]
MTHSDLPTLGRVEALLDEALPMAKLPKTPTERAVAKAAKAARQLVHERKAIAASGYALSDLNKTRTARAKVHKGFGQT